MDQDVVDQAIDYHGPVLCDKLHEEQHNVELPSFLTVMNMQPKYRDSPLDHRYQQDVATFVGTKADLLFESNDCEYKQPDPEQNEEGCLNVCQFFVELYSILPPLESFIEVGGFARREHFYKTLRSGDFVVGQIASIQDSGMVITLLCTEPRAKFIEDLRIPAYCPARDVPKYYAHESPMDAFAIKDKVRAIVTVVQREMEKITVSMHASSLPPNSSGKVKLGLLNEDDIPTYYRNHMNIAGKNYTYQDCLARQSGFSNSSNVQTLCTLLGLDDDKPVSLCRGLHRISFNEDEYAEGLRKRQSARLAIKSVAEGIQKFKESKHSEAMQHFNKALQIDQENVEALVARGAVYANNESYERAIEDFTDALKYDPNHVNAKKYSVETQVVFARTLLDQDGNEESIVKHLKSALELDPDNEEAKEMLIKIHQRSIKSKDKSQKLEKSPEKRERHSSLERTTDTLKKLIAEDDRRHRRSEHRHSYDESLSPLSPGSIRKKEKDASMDFFRSKRKSVDQKASLNPEREKSLDKSVMKRKESLSPRKFSESNDVPDKEKTARLSFQGTSKEVEKKIISQNIFDNRSLSASRDFSPKHSGRRSPAPRTQSPPRRRLHPLDELLGAQAGKPLSRSPSPEAKYKKGGFSRSSSRSRSRSRSRGRRRSISPHRYRRSRSPGQRYDDRSFKKQESRQSFWKDDEWSRRGSEWKMARERKDTYRDDRKEYHRRDFYDRDDARMYHGNDAYNRENKRYTPDGSRKQIDMFETDDGRELDRHDSYSRDKSRHMQRGNTYMKDDQREKLDMFDMFREDEPKNLPRNDSYMKDDSRNLERNEIYRQDNPPDIESTYKRGQREQDREEMSHRRESREIQRREGNNDPRDFYRNDIEQWKDEEQHSGRTYKNRPSSRKRSFEEGMMEASLTEQEMKHQGKKFDDANISSQKPAEGLKSHYEDSHVADKKSFSEDQSEQDSKETRFSKSSWRPVGESKVIDDSEVKKYPSQYENQKESAKVMDKSYEMYSKKNLASPSKDKIMEEIANALGLNPFAFKASLPPTTSLADLNRMREKLGLEQPKVVESHTEISLWEQDRRLYDQPPSDIPLMPEEPSKNMSKDKYERTFHKDSSPPFEKPHHGEIRFREERVDDYSQRNQGKERIFKEVKTENDDIDRIKVEKAEDKGEKKKKKKKKDFNRSVENKQIEKYEGKKEADERRQVKVTPSSKQGKSKQRPSESRSVSKKMSRSSSRSNSPKEKRTVSGSEPAIASDDKGLKVKSKWDDEEDSKNRLSRPIAKVAPALKIHVGKQGQRTIEGLHTGQERSHRRSKSSESSDDDRRRGSRKRRSHSRSSSSSYSRSRSRSRSRSYSRSSSRSRTSKYRSHRRSYSRSRSRERGYARARGHYSGRSRGRRNFGKNYPQKVSRNNRNDSSAKPNFKPFSLQGPQKSKVFVGRNVFTKGPTTSMSLADDVSKRSSSRSHSRSRSRSKSKEDGEKIARHPKFSMPAPEKPKEMTGSKDSLEEMETFLKSLKEKKDTHLAACGSCGEKFATMADLANHDRIKHSLKCVLCEFRAPTGPGMKERMARHMEKRH